MSHASSTTIARQRFIQKIQRVLAEQYRLAFCEAVKNGIAKNMNRRKSQLVHDDQRPTV